MHGPCLSTLAQHLAAAAGGHSLPHHHYSQLTRSPAACSLSAASLQELVRRWPMVAAPGPCAWPERSTADALPEHLQGLAPLLQRDFPTLMGHEAARQLAVGGLLRSSWCVCSVSC